MAVAEEARFQTPAQAHTLSITALLDARMNEMYVQSYACTQGVFTPLDGCSKVMNICRTSGPPALEIPDERGHPLACYNPIWQAEG